MGWIVPPLFHYKDGFVIKYLTIVDMSFIQRNLNKQMNKCNATYNLM